MPSSRSDHLPGLPPLPGALPGSRLHDSKAMPLVKDPYQLIEDACRNCDEEKLREVMNTTQMAELLLNTKCAISKQFPLELAITSSKSQRRREAFVKQLLGYGADPDNFSGSNWVPGPVQNIFKGELEGLSGTTEVIAYYLAKARTVKKWFEPATTKRLQNIQKQSGVANFVEIRRLFFLLIGQSAAIDAMVTNLTTWAFDAAGTNLHESSRRATAIMLAGPSGHGKTFLAKQLETVLGIPYHFVDCSSLSDAGEIFGMSGAYVGSRSGSALNNFVVKNSGRTAIVLFDEFEKANKDLHEKLLNVIDRGQFTDKKLAHGSQTRTVDCSKILFLFTTNAFDPYIMAFAKLNKTKLSDIMCLEMKDAVKRLQQKLRGEMCSVFSKPFAGRIADVIPFLPFTNAAPGSDASILNDEVRVLVGQELTNAQHSLREQTNKIANVVLEFASPADQSRLCRILKGTYDPETGMRGVQNEIKVQITGRAQVNHTRDGVGSSVTVDAQTGYIEVRSMLPEENVQAVKKVEDRAKAEEEDYVLPSAYCLFFQDVKRFLTYVCSAAMRNTKMLHTVSPWISRSMIIMIIFATVSAHFLHWDVGLGTICLIITFVLLCNALLSFLFGFRSSARLENVGDNEGHNFAFYGLKDEY